jgi:hypothetical protein
MEGLNKMYHTGLLFTESVYARLGEPRLPCRLLDVVAVKGKNEAVRIYTAQRVLDSNEEKAWALHNRGMELYLPPARNFPAAAKCFLEVLALLPSDFNARRLLERCKACHANPPPPDWDGVEVIKTK